MLGQGRVRQALITRRRLADDNSTKQDNGITTSLGDQRLYISPETRHHVIAECYDRQSMQEIDKCEE